MNLTRRGFVKATGAAVATSLAFGLTSQSTAMAAGPDKAFKLEGTRESPNICCYCAGGCGSLCSSRWEGDHWELVNVEGDPDHPINEGGLCPKGAAMSQLRNVVDPKTREVIKNPARVTKPMVRRPGASDWEDISWEDAIKEIARHIKDTRDDTFCHTTADAKKYFEDRGFAYPDAELYTADDVTDDSYTAEARIEGEPVICNLTPGICSLGGSQENSEEEYLILKLERALGVPAIDNQARV